MNAARIAAAAAVLATAPALLAAEDAALTCARMLTAAELAEAAGPGFKDMGPVERQKGETECSWLGREGGFKTVALTFYEPAAIDGAIPAFFDSAVKGTEESGSSKHEPMPGIGVRAAWILWGEQMRMYVETKDGVAQIAANGLTKEQAKAVAKAVVTP